MIKIINKQLRIKNHKVKRKNKQKRNQRHQILEITNLKIYQETEGYQYTKFIFSLDNTKSSEKIDFPMRNNSVAPAKKEKN